MTLAACITARTATPAPDALIADLARLTREADLIVQDSASTLTVTAPLARLTVDCTADAIALRLEAEDDTALFHFREYLLWMLDHVAPGLTTGLNWQGDIPRNSAPPNFQTATVRAVRRVAPRFLRVTLACHDITRLIEERGMHFSLLIPPQGRTPIWPRLDENGRAVWPKAADALHRAAYTFVSLDAQAGTFDFDVFEHAGGRATDWARNAQPGDPVALTGPGSGDVPDTTALLIAGDETALPAIRRILEQADPATTGTALVEVGHSDDICPLPLPKGMTLTWLIRAKGEALWDRLATEPLPDSATPFVWVAAEKDLVRRAKARFEGELHLPRAQTYLAYYWAA
ncbi:MAG: NADPH-dependent ferric siderophore reductase [Pseudooceanicola sp.]|jgi:NADPH-dependent ferric siderophore reductase|nr:NADPH-dependent ferric siderophore reductase [Pseudooceanicola sp.]